MDEEHADLVRQLLAQNKALLDDARAACERAEAADKALQDKRDAEFAYNRRAMFAGMAMQGMCSRLPWERIEQMAAGIQGGKTIADAACVQADALIAAIGEP